MLICPVKNTKDWLELKKALGGEDGAYKAFIANGYKTPKLKDVHIPEDVKGESRKHPVVKVISGGETGVEQIGLAVATNNGLGTGGTATLGYNTESGKNMALKDTYGLNEHNTTSYPEKTALNIDNSDGTVLFGNPESVGNKNAIEYAKETNKPIIINPDITTLQKWLNDSKISVLNVTGDRKMRMSADQEFQIASILENALYIAPSKVLLKKDIEKVEPVQEGPTQEEIAKKVTEVNESIISPTYEKDAEGNFLEGADRYGLKGREDKIKYRVTDKSKRNFEKSVGSKKKAQEISNRPENQIKAKVGIRLHDQGQNILDSFFGKGKAEMLEETKKSLTKDQYKVLYNGVKDIADQIKDNQKKINPKGKALVFTENTLFDPINDIAGSMDVFVVYSDGSIAIYDWKFMTLKKDKNGKIIAGPTFNKIDSYDIQINEYKRILRDIYGVTKFRESRIIPVDLQYQRETKNGVSVITEKIKRIRIGKDLSEFLEQIPVGDELTDNETINEVIKELSATVKKLREAKKGSRNRDQIEARIFRLTEAIKKIQKDKDVNGILFEVKNFSDSIRESVGITDDADPSYIGDLKGVKDSIRFYKSMLKFSYKHVESKEALENTTKEEREKTREYLEAADAALSLVEIQVDDRLKQDILQAAEKEDITNIFTPQKESSYLETLYTYLSSWKHPMFRLLNKYVRKINDSTRRDINVLIDKIDEKTTALKKWGRSNGYSGNSVYKLIIDDNGRMISKLSSDYYKERAKAIDNNNPEWIQDNIEYTKESRKKYQEERDRVWKGIDASYKAVPDQAAYLKKLWESQNNLGKKDGEAWLNKAALTKFGTIKDIEKWTNPKFKDIQSKKEVLDFYNFYTATMKELQRVLPYEKNKGERFIPEIHKDIIDTISTNGIMSIKNMGKSFIQSMEVREDDALYGMIDPQTGKPEKRIPILYMNPLTDLNGEPDSSQKSIDLGRSLALFGQSALYYKHANSMEDKILNLQEALSTQRQIVTNKFNEPVKDKAGKLKEAFGKQDTQQAFESFVDYYLYGVKIQSKDVKVKIGEKELSGTKFLLNTMAKWSVTKLGFNLFSAGANLVGATGNAFMTGAKEKFYTSKQMRQTLKEISTMNKKSIGLGAFFEVAQHDLIYEKANKLSMAKLTKWFTADNLMVLQKKGDDFVDKLVTVNMAKNYGIDETTKRVKRLDLLPEGTKSIYDLTSVSEKGISIEGMSEKTFNDFRAKVMRVAGSIKGTTTSEDINLIQTNVLGRVAMQFRNWLPRMAQERFRKGGYDHSVEDIELGRFRVGFSALVHQGFLPAAAKFTAQIATGWTGLYKYTPEAGRVDKGFADFLAENPDILDEYGSIEQAKKAYQAEYTGQLRALAAELRMYTMVLGAMAAMGLDYDDDDVPLSKEYSLTRMIYRFSRRSALELGFFLSPSEATQVLRKPVAIMGLLTDLANIFVNGAQESYDYLQGIDDPRDKTPFFHYFRKNIPILGPTLSTLDTYYDGLDKVFGEDND